MGSSSETNGTAGTNTGQWRRLWCAAARSNTAKTSSRDWMLRRRPLSVCCKAAISASCWSGSTTTRPAADDPSRRRSEKLEADAMGVLTIGQAVRREEDWRLLRGRGRYVDDAGRADDACGYVLRSPHAHALIRAIDTTKAEAASGVLAVLTGEDLRRRGLGTLMPGVRRRRRNGAPAFACPQPLLAQGQVRYIGDPVAFIVAETSNQAKDAAEL